jgi:hypothetical protein
MGKKLKIGEKAIMVNMDFIHKGYLAHNAAQTLFQEIIIERIDEHFHEKELLWVNTCFREEFVFDCLNAAKEFVKKYLKKEILRNKKEVLNISLLINRHEQILLEND